MLSKEYARQLMRAFFTPLGFAPFQDGFPPQFERFWNWAMPSPPALSGNVRLMNIAAYAYQSVHVWSAL